MNEKPNDGGPAFPSTEPTKIDDKEYFLLKGGMSLRDWFAGMALRGILDSWERPITDEEFKGGVAIPIKENVAKVCYEFADAMIAERSKK